MYWHPNSPPQSPTQYYAFQSNQEPNLLPQERTVPSKDSQIAFAATEAVIRNGSKKRRACNECKQQKLRCDLSTLVRRNQDSCSRCNRLSLDCRIDQDFRRKRKRKRSDELEREVDSLRRELSRRSKGSETTNMGEMNVLSSPSVALRTSLDGVISPTSTYVPDYLGATARLYPRNSSIDGSEESMDQMNTIARESKALGNVQLSANQVDELFTMYFTFYHPFLPILDPGRSPAQYYESSALLFWTMVSVASRRIESEPSLLTRLAPCVTNLTWQHIKVPPHSEYVVKSLALLCTWPLPNSSGVEDVTYLWAGAMMNIGILTGLHRPMNPREFSENRVQRSDVDDYERARLWKACKIVAQSVSIGTGLALPIQFDWSLPPGPQTDCPTRTLDPDLSLCLRIETFRTKVSRALSPNMSFPTGLSTPADCFSLLKIFTQELDALEESLPDISSLNRFHILAARLHLHSFSLLEHPSAESYTQRILTLYFAAAALTQHMLDADRAWCILHIAPFAMQRIFVVATCILLRVLGNGYFAAFLDGREGDEMLSEALEAVRKMGWAGDEFMRGVADAVEGLWHGRGKVRGKVGLELVVRDRGSMSVVCDLLARWREWVSG
ncbi:hypothetical protein CC78DRAFT_474285 [Lojkania enalia]|uniref:Zn(2)-C6 fungal-type domain-containing protein n=1 Tax=Lojkania enalia TaxID=147567 RepID=A0A9P4JZ50_9PLEO|nr:hypothetical protein CC78DRAFT_474285 [Didymosphaeria enalia]